MIPQPAKGSFARTETIPQQSDTSTLNSEQKKVDELMAGNKNLNANTITNEIFFDRHSNLRGTSIPKDSPLSDEWKKIKSDIVEPRMTATSDQPSAEVSESQQSPSANASAEAADRKGFLNMGADYLRKSLDNVMDGVPRSPVKPKEDPLGECLPESGGPNPVRAQELAKVDTSKMTETQKYDHLKELIETGGGTFNAEPGAGNIVSVRDQDSVDAGVKNANKEGQGVYNDRMAVLWKDEDGTPHVKEYMGNTEPNRRWANDEHGSQDVNNDQKNDAGRLLPGFYEFKVDKRNGDENALRPTSGVKVERDLNGDGLYNDNHIDDKAGTSILFHDGKGNNSTGSAGCQTLKEDDFPKFWEAVSQRTNTEHLGYTLVQMDEPAPVPTADAAE